jgi:hypothetical protein
VLDATGSPDRLEIASGVGVVDSQTLIGIFFFSRNAECTAESIAGRTAIFAKAASAGRLDQSRQEVVTQRGGACGSNHRPWYCRRGPGYET